MSRIYIAIALFVLALAVASVPATAQQTYSATPPAMGAPAGPTQSFSLGGGTSYHITPISLGDGWRSAWIGIPRVSMPGGSTAYVIHSADPMSIGKGTGPANTIVFGPNGYAGAVAWDGKSGGLQSFPFTGGNGQFYMVTQLSGGTTDHAVVSFD